MQDGTFSNLDFDFTLDGEIFSELYLLVDGIYPQLSRFVKTFAVPTTKIECVFA